MTPDKAAIEAKLDFGVASNEETLRRRAMKKGVRVWTCDGCGKRETWRRGWMWWPGVVSPRDPEQPAVACSDACEDIVFEKCLHATTSEKVLSR
jgi:hypothetical protein